MGIYFSNLRCVRTGTGTGAFLAFSSASRFASRSKNMPVTPVGIKMSQKAGFDSTMIISFR